MRSPIPKQKITWWTESLLKSKMYWPFQGVSKGQGPEKTDPGVNKEEDHTQITNATTADKWGT